MRLVALLLTLTPFCAADKIPAGTVWAELEIKRQKLGGVHQEFDVSRTYTVRQSTRSSKRQIVLDMSQNRWREKSVSGSGSYIRIFNSEGVFSMEEDGAEYVREKYKPKEGAPVPVPYKINAEWGKAVEVQRRPCGLPKDDHPCVVLEAPLKRWIRPGVNGHFTQLLQGTVLAMLDLETGLLLSSRVIETVEASRGDYQSEEVYVLKQMGYGLPPDPTLFQLPAGGSEVKELPRWNAARIKKQLVGKAAPGFSVTDLRGETFALADFKGKTVLLDFWTTWCPPCRADGPALEKLYKKYAGKNLAILGISVSEDRAIVEKFLSDHPHTYPIVLTSENELPRPYQVGAFPTYIVIGPDGTLTAVVDGETGFGELRKLLEKAGLETE